MGRSLSAWPSRLLSRFFQFVLSLLLLLVVSFGLLSFFPGSPWNDEQNLDPQIIASLRDFYGLNQSLWKQFLIYLRRILSGDFGVSMHFAGRSVGSLIWEYGQTSFTLGVCAFALALVGAFLFVFCSRYFSKWKNLSDTVLLVWISFPTLALAPVCIWLFAIRMEWVPVALLNHWSGYVLPVILLSLKPMLSLARVLASSLDEVLREKYVQNSRALGHSEISVLCKWAFKNSLGSFLTQLGPMFASLISGSFLIEVLFAIPGLGFQFIDSVLNRDWPLVLGLTLVYGFIVMFTQLITDFIIFIVDPRAETL